MAHIKLLKGIDAGKIIPLHQEIILGRASDSDICLPDPRVSRRHARISQHEGHFAIEDLQSSNGTLLRNSRLFPGTLYKLYHGDKIKIGSTLMAFMDELSESKFTESQAVEAKVSKNKSDRHQPLETDSSLLEVPSPQDECQNEEHFNTQGSSQVWPSQYRKQVLTLQVSTDNDSSLSASASWDALIDIAKMYEPRTKKKCLDDTAKRLQTICQISIILSAIKDKNKLMQKVVDYIFDIFPSASRSFILLYDPISKNFKIAIIKERFPVLCKKTNIFVSKTVINKVAIQKCPILSSDTINDIRFNHQASIIDLTIRSMMCVPLLIDEELLGLIQVDNYKNKQLFNPEDLHILAGIGAQTAIAVKNAQLHEQVKTETARRTSLQRYFSSRLVKMIMSDNVMTSLGGNSYRGTILFADIIGFTTMSESMAPSDVLSKLNRYLTFMQKLIHQNGGNIDKVNGDSLMAFWGVPQGGEMDEGNAVLTALQMQKSLWSFNLELKDEGQQPIYMGIGLNTGEFIAGNIGSEDKIEFTLIGDNVNLASRIEHLAGRNQVLVSETTWQPIKHLVSAIQLPPLLVRGRSTPITIYSIRGMQHSQDDSYVMALPCHLLNDTGLHVGSGIITGFTSSGSSIFLYLSTPTSLICNNNITLQMQTFEYHKPILCIVRVDSVMTEEYKKRYIYTKAILTYICSSDEEIEFFFKPGNCLTTTYTWNDLKRR